MEHKALAAGWVCVGVNTVIAAVTSYGRICVPAQGVTHKTRSAQRRSHPNPTPNANVTAAIRVHPAAKADDRV